MYRYRIDYHFVFYSVFYLSCDCIRLLYISYVRMRRDAYFSRLSDVWAMPMAEIHIKNFCLPRITHRVSLTITLIQVADIANMTINFRAYIA